jgi:ferredoxin-NADP reductase
MAAKIREYEASVSDIIIETPETKTFRFLMNEKPEFKPGQFVMLTFEVPGKGPVTRPYSISSCPLDAEIEITIKKYEAGVLSKYIIDNVKVGDKCKMKGPYGVFVFDESAKKIVFIAAGSGIAPFRSMWRYALQKHLDTKISILFSSKSKNYIIFRKELDTIANNGVRVIHTLTRNEDPSWKGYSRRIDGGMIREAIGSDRDCLYYLCGPAPMCNSIIDVLEEMGIDQKQIKTEKFE